MSYQPIKPRARIGFIIPSSNRTVEPNLHRYFPYDVAPHVTRLRMSGRHRRPLPEMAAEMAAAASVLADSRCDVVCLQCTGTAMSGGVEQEKEIVKAMEEATGKPAVTAGTSCMAALRALKARRIVFITKEDTQDGDHQLAYMRECGIEIIGGLGAGAGGSDRSCAMPPELWFDTTLKARNDQADAYFISCANIRAVDVIERLERELGRPIVTSNQAAIWHSLRTAGIHDRIEGLGRLLRLNASEPVLAAE